MNTFLRTLQNARSQTKREWIMHINPWGGKQWLPSDRRKEMDMILIVAMVSQAYDI